MESLCDTTYHLKGYLKEGWYKKNNKVTSDARAAHHSLGIYDFS